MNARLHLRMNPIIVKELRSRMRDARAFITLTGVLLLLGGGSYLLYRIVVATSYYSSTPLSPQIGRSLFMALAFLELMMVAAIAPAVTAGAVSNEKEKQTYEMLLATPLRPGSILWGKLISALSYVFLLIFAAIPMASLIFIFGGVTLREMGKALIIIVSVAVLLGMLGLFMSTWLGRTSRATVLSYLLVALMLVGPVVAYIAVGVLKQAEPPRWLLIPNPLSALFSALMPSTGNVGGGMDFLWAIGSSLGGNLRMLTGPTVSMSGFPRPLYHYSLPLYALTSVVLYWLSSRLIRPTRRWHITWKEAAIWLLVLAMVIGASAAAFLLTTERYERVSVFEQPPVEPRVVTEPAMPAVVEERVVVAPQSGESETIVTEDDGEAGSSDSIQAYPAPDPDIASLIPGLSISEGELAQIYVTITDQLLSTSNLFNGVAPGDIAIYFQTTTDDNLLADLAPYLEPVAMPGSLQNKMTELSMMTAKMEGNFPYSVQWVDSSKEVPVNDGLPKTALVYLSTVRAASEDRILAVVAISDLESNVTGRYYLKIINGDWQIVEEING